jgi:hypothetical protein
MAKVQITKFDAIRAQIDAAIELYFVSDNIVATHTLAAAAYNVLRDLADRDGSEHPFLKSGFLKTLSESEKKQLIQFLNKPENFFKHADHDPNDSLSFDPELTEILLMDACAYFKNSDIQKPKNYEIFKAWVGKIKDDIPIGNDSRIFVETLLEAFKAGGKKQFWEKFSKHLTNRSTGRAKAARP